MQPLSPGFIGIDTKSSIQSLLLLTLLIISLSANIAYAVPSGPSGEDSYTISLDRTEYKPSDTVIIKVDNSFYHLASGKTHTLQRWDESEQYISCRWK